MAAATYSGDKLTPAVTVQATVNGKTATLKKGTDYTVSYSNNTDASNKAKATIKGKGNFKGTVDKTFTISKLAISKCKITVAAAKYNKGKAVKGKVTVKSPNGKKTFTAKTGYTLKYSNNKKKGKSATVKITGTKNLSGSVSKKFTIK